MIENKKTYKVYSDLLNKPFDSIEELEAAEAEARKAEEEKQRAANNRKAEADDVKAAIVHRVEVETEAKKDDAEAYREYLARLERNQAKIKDAKKAENEKLTKFCEKHGSFHDTIKIGDITYNCDYSTSRSYVDPFEKLLGFLF